MLSPQPKAADLIAEETSHGLPEGLDQGHQAPDESITLTISPEGQAVHEEVGADHPLPILPSKVVL